MNRVVSRAAASVRRFWSSRRGATAVTVALMMVPILGITGFAVDLGRAYSVSRSLQASSDAAALAAAQDINCCSTGGGALATASAYSSVTGGKNPIPSVTVTMVSGYPKLKCLTSISVSCTGSDNANAIQVRQQAVVPTIFARAVGLNTITVAAQSTAGARGGISAQLDVMIVVDTTGSMNSSDSNCSVAGASRIACAKAGVRALLLGLDPSVDQVGLMVFPGLTDATQPKYDYDCASSPQPAIAKYSANPLYQILGFSSDFKTVSGATILNTGSNLVKAVGGGASNCTQGMDAVGGVATYYADTITAAETALETNGRPHTQKVIVLLSDGDANASASNMPAGKQNNQCAEAVAAATAAAAKGTWIYSVAYGADNSASSSCSTDNPHVSACATMQHIASDPSKFFADTTGGSACASTAHSLSELVAIFSAIGQSMQQPRLLPDNTT